MYVCVVGGGYMLVVWWMDECVVCDVCMFVVCVVDVRVCGGCVCSVCVVCGGCKFVWCMVNVVCDGCMFVRCVVDVCVVDACLCVVCVVDGCACVVCGGWDVFGRHTHSLTHIHSY